MYQNVSETKVRLNSGLQAVSWVQKYFKDCYKSCSKGKKITSRPTCYCFPKFDQSRCMIWWSVSLWMMSKFWQPQVKASRSKVIMMPVIIEKHLTFTRTYSFQIIIVSFGRGIGSFRYCISFFCSGPNLYGCYAQGAHRAFVRIHFCARECSLCVSLLYTNCVPQHGRPWGFMQNSMCKLSFMGTPDTIHWRVYISWYCTELLFRKSPGCTCFLKPQLLRWWDWILLDKTIIC